MKKSIIVVLLIIVFCFVLQISNVIINVEADDRSIGIIYPSEGEILYKGKTYNITWDSVNVTNNIGISLINKTAVGGFQNYHYIAENISNSGIFKWNIPEDFLSGNYSLLVYKFNNESSYDLISDSVNITIKTWIEPSETTPGFELILVIFVMVSVLVWKRKYK